MENEKPEITSEQKLVEGNIWVDKLSGEIRYDPKKNRNDHRHHAIDAITIALTKQSYLQKLSTYNANKDEKYRGNKYEKPQFDEPWDNFFNDVKKAASNILISHKQNNHVLTEISKTVFKNGKKYKSKGFAARGQLHKEFVYGKRKSPNTEQAFHIRKSINSLTTDKQLNKIVDPVVRDIIIKARKEEKIIKVKITELEKKLKTTKTDFEEQEIKKQINDLLLQIKLLYTLPNKKGEDKDGEPVPIRKVRIKEKISNAVKLKEANQYVNPRNNHHVIIYKDTEGNLHEDVVSFWTAVERKLQKQPVFQLPKPEVGKPEPAEIVTTLQINDMFILGLSDDEFESNINNYPFLSKHLFRVQKFTSGDYYFRHHLASTINNDLERIYIKNFGEGKTGWETFNPIKVKIDYLGRITKIEK